MREWLSGGAPPCQGGGRGFDPRLALEGGFRVACMGGSELFFFLSLTKAEVSIIIYFVLRNMREWLSGGAPPCQGGGRGFDPRLALFLCSGCAFDGRSRCFCLRACPAGSRASGNSEKSPILKPMLWKIRGNHIIMINIQGQAPASARYRYHHV